jgi:hypothetical protein
MNPRKWSGPIILATVLMLGPGVDSVLAQSESAITLPRLGSAEWLILWLVLA